MKELVKIKIWNKEVKSCKEMLIIISVSVILWSMFEEYLFWKRTIYYLKQYQFKSEIPFTF